MAQDVVLSELTEMLFVKPALHRKNECYRTTLYSANYMSHFHKSVNSLTHTEITFIVC